MAEQNEIVAKLILDSQEATKDVKSIKQELKEASIALLDIKKRFGDTSPEALALAKHVSELKDQMADAKEVVDLFDPGAKFQVFGNVIKTISGGFSALTGTMALFGAESEDVQKTIAKLQATLAITEGVNTIVDSVKDFERLGSVIKQTTLFKKADEVVTKAAAATQRLFGISVETTATSFQVLKGAIAATGIGLLVVGIGELVSLTTQWASATERAAEAQKALKESVTNLANVGLKAEQEAIIREEKLQIARAKARGASEQEIYEIQEGWQKTRITSQQRHYDEVAKVDEVAAEESKHAIKGLQTDLTILQLNFQSEQRKRAEEEEKKRQERAKQNADKRKQELAAALERERGALAELQRMRDENYLAEEQNENEREKSRIVIAAEREKERINALQISSSLRLKLLDEVRRKERDDLAKLEKEQDAAEKAKDAERLQAGLQRIMDQAALSREQVAEQNDLRRELIDEQRNEFEIQLAELDDEYKYRLQVVRDNEELYNQIVESYERQRTAIIAAQGQQRLSIVGDLLGRAADLFGRQTAAGKGLAIAEATINTFAGATAALRSKVPFPEPVATGIRIAQAALIVATGLKSIREIAKTQVPGGGGSAANVSASLSSAAAPIASTPTIQTTQLDQQTIDGIGNAAPPIRAFVVESDVTTNQEKIERLNRAARLGN